MPAEPRLSLTPVCVCVTVLYSGNAVDLNRDRDKSTVSQLPLLVVGGGGGGFLFRPASNLHLKRIAM